MADFYFLGISRPPVRHLERSTVRVRTGRYALRSFCKDPKQGTEINCNNLIFTPEKQYRFSFDYFVSTAAGKKRLAGRFTFPDAKGKILRHSFPEWKSAPGEWNTAKLVSHPPVNCARVTVTVWIIGSAGCTV